MTKTGKGSGRNWILILAAVAAGSAMSLHAQTHKPSLHGRHWMAITGKPLSVTAGAKIFERGGNAVDAAIAVGFALAVTHPAAGNLGGGGFMMIRLKNGKTTAIDYREMAPAAAHRNVYLDKNGELIKGEGGSLVGYRAAGIPGTVRGMELALKKYGSGRLTWSQLVEPARRLLRTGLQSRIRLLVRYATATNTSLNILKPSASI